MFPPHIAVITTINQTHMEKLGSMEKLFGLFNVQVDKDVVIDSETGKIVSVNESFWTKVIEFFSL